MQRAILCYPEMPTGCVRELAVHGYDDELAVEKIVEERL